MKLGYLPSSYSFTQFRYFPRGTSFSCLQATWQPKHPTHFRRSTSMAQRAGFGAGRVRAASAASPPVRTPTAVAAPARAAPRRNSARVIPIPGASSVVFMCSPPSSLLEGLLERLVTRIAELRGHHRGWPLRRDVHRRVTGPTGLALALHVNIVKRRRHRVGAGSRDQAAVTLQASGVARSGRLEMDRLEVRRDVRAGALPGRDRGAPGQEDEAAQKHPHHPFRHRSLLSVTVHCCRDTMKTKEAGPYAGTASFANSITACRPRQRAGAMANPAGVATTPR